MYCSLKKTLTYILLYMFILGASLLIWVSTMFTLYKKDSEGSVGCMLLLFSIKYLVGSNPFLQRIYEKYQIEKEVRWLRWMSYYSMVIISVALVVIFYEINELWHTLAAGIFLVIQLICLLIFFCTRNVKKDCNLKKTLIYVIFYIFVLGGWLVLWSFNINALYEKDHEASESYMLLIFCIEYSVCSNPSLQPLYEKYELEKGILWFTRTFYVAMLIINLAMVVIFCIGNQLWHALVIGLFLAIQIMCLVSFLCSRKTKKEQKMQFIDPGENYNLNKQRTDDINDIEEGRLM